MIDYLNLIRKLTSSSEVVFPHCACDSRKKGGHVVACFKFEIFLLKACTIDGVFEVNIGNKTGKEIFLQVNADAEASI
jgi:sorting nexin-27